MRPITWDEVIAQNKQASEWLLRYNDRRKAYIEKRASFTELGSTAYTGMPKGFELSRPTESKAISLVDLQQQELWIMTIEDVHSILTDKKMIFLNARRLAEIMCHTGEQGRPGWVSETAKIYCSEIEKKYGYYNLPNVKTVREWWREIIHLTVRIAQRRGCL